MNLSEYKGAIFKSRSIPYKATTTALDQQVIILEMAVSHTNGYYQSIGQCG